MTEKALISELTWRSLEMQRAAFPGMPHFIAPDEVTELLRPSTRKEVDRVNVLSLGVIAEKETEFREFIALLCQRGAILRSKEESIDFNGSKKNIPWLVKEWKAARRNGIQVIGGRISAKLREDEHRKACDAIKDRWPLPEKTWKTSVLLREAGKTIGKKKITYNTAKKYLGRRPLEQANYEAKEKRRRSKEERINA